MRKCALSVAWGLTNFIYARFFFFANGGSLWNLFEVRVLAEGRKEAGGERGSRPLSWLCERSIFDGHHHQGNTFAEIIRSCWYPPLIWACRFLSFFLCFFLSFVHLTCRMMMTPQPVKMEFFPSPSECTLRDIYWRLQSDDGSLFFSFISSPPPSPPKVAMMVWVKGSQPRLTLFCLLFLLLSLFPFPSIFLFFFCFCLFGHDETLSSTQHICWNHQIMLIPPADLSWSFSFFLSLCILPVGWWWLHSP